MATARIRRGRQQSQCDARCRGLHREDGRAVRVVDVHVVHVPAVELEIAIALEPESHQRRVIREGRQVE